MKSNLASAIKSALNSVRKDAETLRSEIAATVADIEDLESRPRPIAEAMANFERTMNYRAEQASTRQALYLLGIPEGGASDVHLVGESIAAPAFLGTDGKVTQTSFIRGVASEDIDGVLWSLFPDAIRANVETRLAAWYATQGASMTASDRDAALTKARNRLAELERAEEDLIAEAEDAGIAITRRADVSAAAYLEAEG